MKTPIKSGLPRRFRTNADGVTAIEFALVAPVLVLFIAGLIEIGLMMAAQSILDDATFSGSRTGKTSYVGVDAKTGVSMTQDQTILASIRKAAGSYLDPEKITLTKTAHPDYGSIGNAEPFVDKNKNNKYDAGESFTDRNGNGKYDDGKGTEGAGASGEIVVYTAKYDWRLKTPALSEMLGTNGVVPLTSKTVVKNEPF